MLGRSEEQNDAAVSDTPLLTQPRSPTSIELIKLYGHQTLPCIGERIVDTASGFINNLFLARSPNPLVLPASTFMNTFQQFLMNFNIMTMTSVNTVTGQHQNDREKIGEIFRNGIALSTVLGTSTILICVFSKDILVGFKQDPELAEIAQNYLRLYAIGVLPELYLATEKNLVAGMAKKPYSNTVVETISAAITTGLGYMLMFGVGEIPPMQEKGLAIASAIASWSCFISYTAYVFKNYSGQASFKIAGPTKDTFFELVKFGLPSGMMLGVEIGTIFASALMAGRLGRNDLSAQQICSSLYMLPLGFTIAMAHSGMTCVSKAIGNNQEESVKKLFLIANGFGLAFAIFASSMIFVFKDTLIDIFIENQQENHGAALLAGKVIGLNCLFYLADSARFITSFSSIPKDEGIGILLSTIIGLLFIGLPLSGILGLATNLGLIGLTIGRGAGVTTGAAISGFFAKKCLAPATLEIRESPNESLAVDPHVTSTAHKIQD
jgi:MATE family multidrug resistance protein